MYKREGLSGGRLSFNVFTVDLLKTEISFAMIDPGYLSWSLLSVTFQQLFDNSMSSNICGLVSKIGCTKKQPSKNEAFTETKVQGILQSERKLNNPAVVLFNLTNI